MTLKKVLALIATGSAFLILLTPFVFYTGMYFPFIAAKAYYFRTIVELGFFAWLGLAVLDPHYRPKKSWILISVSVFVAIVGIAALQGVNPYYSFWSNFERMEGYVTFLHLLALFFVLGGVMRTRQLWNWFLNTAVVIGVLQFVWAAFQVGGVLAVGMSANRIDGTLGNATYLAIYMVFTVFFSVLLLVKHKGAMWVRYWYMLAIILSTITVFWTATRGSLLGLVGGLVLSLILMSLFNKKQKWLRNVTFASIAGVALLAVLVFGFKDSVVVQNIHALRRVASISFTETTTVARFYNWQTAWEGVKERPLLGYGLGNYGVVFDQNYNPKMWNQEQWFDRVHNIIFDWLIAGGFVGLLSYISLFVALLYYIWRPSHTFTNTERSVLTGLLAAYCFHNLFVFDNLVSYIYFIVILAFVHTRVAKETEHSPVHDPQMAKVIAVLLVVLAFPLTAWAVSGPSYVQNTLLIKAMRIPDINRLNEITSIFEQSLEKETFGDTETRQQLMIFTGKIIETQGGELTDKQALAAFAGQQLQKELDVRPNDPKFLALGGQFLAQTGNFEQSVELFKRAAALSPKKQSLYQPIVEVLFKLGKNEEALALSYDVLMIEPENDVMWRQYVRSLLRAGKKDEYDALIEEAFTTGRGERVIGLVLQNLASDPNNVQVHASLAVAYYRSGLYDTAISVFKQLGDRFPDAKPQADALIKKIEAGEPIL